MSVYPKPKTGLMVFLILVGSLSIRADVPLFTLTGRIINQDGSSADGGLSVKVSNQSKSLVNNVATDSDGNYRAIFIKTPEGSVIASLNDQLRVQVLDDQGQVIGSADHLITADNLAQSFAQLDVPIFISTPPVASNQSTEASEDTAVQITLTATDQDSQTLTYTVVSAPANGSLSGTAPNLTYRPNPDFTGVDTFTFQASDRVVNSNTATISITVTAVDDQALAAGQTVFTLQNQAVPVTLKAVDVDGDALTYAVVSVPADGSLSGTAPDLTYTPTTDFTGSDTFTFKANDGTSDSNTAVVSVITSPPNLLAFIVMGQVTNHNGKPSDSGWQVKVTNQTKSLIKQVTTDVESKYRAIFIDTAQGGVVASANDQLRVQVLDAGSNVIGQTDHLITVHNVARSLANINVQLVASRAPTASDQSVVTTEDASVQIKLMASDPDRDALTYAIVTPPQNGSFIGTAPQLIYLPQTNFNGSDTFTFKANDGAIDSNIATVSITITPVDNAPIADSQALTTSEDTALTITLIATEVDGQSLTYVVVSQPSHGSLSGNVPNLTYMPQANFTGADAFTFRANDGNLDSKTTTIAVKVTAVNDTPQAHNRWVSTYQDRAVAVGLTTTEVDGDGLTYFLLSTPSNGALSGTAPNLTYTPNPNYAGSDSFTFKVNDGIVDSNTATVSITVIAVNPPQASSQSVQTAEDTPLQITLSATDIDGDALTYTIVSQPSNGILSGLASNLTYTPGADFSGSDSFTFQTNDGIVDGNTAAVSITVTAVDDVPVAESQLAYTIQNQALPITLTVKEVDGDGLTYTIVSAPANGALSGTAPHLTYTPTADFSGADSFTFKVNDGISDSNTATTSIIISRGHIPTFIVIGQVTNHNGKTSEGGLRVKVTNQTKSTVKEVNTEANGKYRVISIDTVGGGVVASANDQLRIEVMDADGNVLGFTDQLIAAHDIANIYAEADVQFAVSRKPEVQNQSIATDEDTAVPIRLQAADIDRDPVTYALLSQPTSGILSGTAPNLTYTPQGDFNGSDTFTFQANDGTIDSNIATVSIAISPINDSLVVQNQSIATHEDEARNITLAVTDVDGDGLTSIIDQPSNGILSGTAPNLAYTPNPDFNGSDAFTFQTSDGTYQSQVGYVAR